MGIQGRVLGMDTERQRGTFFLWWFVPQNRSWCDKKTLPVLGRIGNSQKEAHQVATLFMMVEKCRAPEPARPQRCTQSIWHVNRLGTESPVGGYEEYRYDFRDSFWLGANKFYVPRFEQIKNIKKIFCFCFYCIFTLLLVLSPLTC